MSSRRWITYLGAASVAGLCGLMGSDAGPFAGPGAGPGKKPEDRKPRNEIVQTFPSNDAMKTAWKVHWATTSGFGLYIEDAWFKKGPKEPWIQVLGDARVSEIFVPYHSGSPRFWDISYNFELCRVTKNEAGPYGKLLGDPPTVVQEVRDRGLIWYDYSGGRRGQELVLFGTLSAANYRYIIHYAFRDDGSIGFRLGSTGRNYGSREYQGHMHNGLWRIDVNLDGPDHNSVLLVEHIEPAGDEHKEQAKSVQRPFNGGREGFADWNAEKFTHLCVINEKKKNARAQPWAYDLVPMRMGNARHHGGDNEDCTHHDFWVTKNRPGEIHYTHLPQYVQKKERIQDTDVVLWHSAPGHHQPRSEDGAFVKGKDGERFVGCTPVMWSGFDMHPRNFWDRSPMYP